jgi:hypothetical protein
MYIYIKLVTLNGITIPLRMKPHPPHLTPLNFSRGSLDIRGCTTTVREALLHSMSRGRPLPRDTATRPLAGSHV